MKKLVLTLFVSIIISNIYGQQNNIVNTSNFSTEKNINELYNQEDYDSLIIMLKVWEGYRGYVYNCLAGGLVVGYGHAINSKQIIYYKNGISENVASKILKKDLDISIVYAYQLTNLKGKQLLAVSALLFNVGTRQFSESTLLTLIKEDSYLVGDRWLLWAKYLKNKKLVYNAHLYSRRKWEVNFYETGRLEIQTKKQLDLISKF